jgi:hypothetical protein
MHFISIPRRDLLTDEFVRSSLHQAGLQEVEIQSFITAAKV